MPDVQQLMTDRFGDAFRPSMFRDNVRYVVLAARLIEVMTFLRTEGRFDFLVDIAGMDYLHCPDATDGYGVVYCLANSETAERVYVKVLLNDPEPRVKSVYPIWKGADWMEREIYDMYGVVFEGHPDLRRILMPEGFALDSLLKGYP